MNPILKTLLRFMIATIAIYILFVGLMVGFQKKLLFIPASGTYESPDSMGVSGEDVWMTTEDGVKLHGWYLPNIESEYVILFSHGNAGNISMRTELAGMLLESRASVFLYDYRGYGLSEGSPGEKGLYTDVRTAVKYLTEEKNIPVENIILYGRSLGGAVAAYAATEFGVGGLVLDSAFIDIRTVIKDIYPFIPPGLARVDFNTNRYVNAREEMPLMILHSPEDRLIGYHHGLELYNNASGPKRFVELQGGHNNNYSLSKEIFTSSWKDFLNDLEAARRDMKVQREL
ncbi:MAG: alpha/beta hydrolase [Balneolaceae bacterium]